MPYHSGLTRIQGDPGFFSFLGKAITTVARAIPGPVGAIAGAIFPPTGAPPVVPIQPAMPAPFPLPGFTRTDIPRAGAGRTIDVTVDPVTGAMCPKKKRRRIDPLNIKALRRANTRQRSFLRAVDRTLKTMPTKGSVSSRRKKISGAVK